MLTDHRAYHFGTFFCTKFEFSTSRILPILFLYYTSFRERQQQEGKTSRPDGPHLFRPPHHRYFRYKTDFHLSASGRAHHNPNNREQWHAPKKKKSNAASKPKNEPRDAKPPRHPRQPLPLKSQATLRPMTNRRHRSQILTISAITFRYPKNTMPSFLRSTSQPMLLRES